MGNLYFIYNIYYDAPNFEKAPVYHNWKMLSDLLKYSSAFDYSNEVWEKLYCFEYMKNDDDLLLKMNESVEATRLLIILEFEKIKNLEACIKWYDKYLYQISVNPSRFIHENEPVFARYNELFLLTESVEQYHRRLDNNFVEEINRHLYDAKKRGDEEQCVKYGEIRNNFDKEEKKRYEQRRVIYEKKQKISSILELFQKQKEENIEYYKNVGIEIGVMK